MAKTIAKILVNEGTIKRIQNLANITIKSLENKSLDNKI